MGSQPNFGSRSEVVSIYKYALQKIGKPYPQIWGTENIKFWTTFPRLPHSTPHISGMKRRIDKQKC